MADLTLSEARKILNLQASYTEEELKKSYRSLAREHHPDHGGNQDVFKQVQQAYEKLTKTSMTEQEVRRIEDIVLEDIFFSHKR